VRPFAPPRLARGGHVQTLLGYALRRRLRWPHPSEDVVAEAGDGVRLLLRASWQPGPAGARPALILIHGLGGRDDGGYTVATGRLAFARGWHVVRMNMRGAGDGARLSRVLYNAGLDGDVVAAMGAVAQRAPRVAVVGFSLGANLALLAFGRSAARLPEGTLGVVGISPPLDLSACVEAVHRRINRPYERSYLRELCAAYRACHRARPDVYAAGREEGVSSIRDYDARVTAFYGGYRDVDDYYSLSSSGPWLRAIERPTLLVCAADDPMIPRETVERWPLPAQGRALREILTTGGHVGFVSRTGAPGMFWAGERAVEFLGSCL
jgi:uncharacterized protein